MKTYYKSTDKPGSSVVSFKEARALAEEHGTPLLVCDLERVGQNYARLKELVPGAELYFAVKANPHPKILKTLAGLGSSFDVASKEEIRMCLEAGAEPERLLYANPVKARSHIEFAYENNVRTFTYDSKLEVEKMAEHAPGSDVILRVAVKDVGSVCKFSAKFGAREKQAMELLKMAAGKGLNPIGLSFHVGSQCKRIQNYASALDLCSRIFEKARRNGFELSVLDIGGGIPIRYVEDVYSFEDLSQLLNNHTEGRFPPETRIIMEPGRPMVGDSMTLLSRVIGINKRNGRDCLYLDDGCYNSLSEKVFGHCEYRIVSDRQGDLRKYKVFGPTCDSMDVVSTASYLPQPEEGDLLLVLNAGAYTNAAATRFNGFPPAKIVFI